jgi:Fe-Mn family superoxide dismutase
MEIHMAQFEERKFNIPELKGISAKNIEEHLKLYAGYVKHTNLILEKITEYGQDSEKHAYALGEIQRRFGFEFDGMRNHEYYFEQLEGGASSLPEGSTLKSAIEKEWGSYDAWLARFKAIAMTRGIGWAILSFDPVTKRLVNSWVDEQHLGHLTGLKFIFGIDMWEHSFVFDYQPSGKKQYVEDYLANVNWSKVEERFNS